MTGATGITPLSTSDHTGEGMTHQSPPPPEGALPDGVAPHRTAADDRPSRGMTTSDEPVSVGKPRASVRPRIASILGAAAILLAAAATIISVGDSDPGRSTESGIPADREHGPATERQAGAPTGVRIEYNDDIQLGECVDIQHLPDDFLALHRADCATAGLVLENVQRSCPTHSVSVVRGGLLTSCFAWVVEPGDCISLAEYRKIPCGRSATTSGADNTSVEIVTVITGAYDGRRCNSPDQYVLTGHHDRRGVACYRDMPDTPTPSRNEKTATIPSPTVTR